jgi:hypothetical protein
MLVKLGEQAHECRLYVDCCAAKAELQTDPKLRQSYLGMQHLKTDPKLRQVYLHMQHRWLSLARSYEFSEQLEVLSVAEERNKESRLMLVGQEPE